MVQVSVHAMAEKQIVRVIAHSRRNAMIRFMVESSCSDSLLSWFSNVYFHAAC